MTKIIWQDSFSVGIKLIDSQHKKLFSILNNLQNVVNNNDLEMLEGIIFDLKAYVKFHFNEEEKYFERFNYEQKESHIEQHQIYINKINDFHARYLKNDITTTKKLLDFINYWILNHINIEDKKYSKCFKDNGLI